MLFSLLSCPVHSILFLCHPIMYLPCISLTIYPLYACLHMLLYINEYRSFHPFRLPSFRGVNLMNTGCESSSPHCSHAHVSQAEHVHFILYNFLVETTTFWHDFTYNIMLPIFFLLIQSVRLVMWRRNSPCSQEKATSHSVVFPEFVFADA